MEPGPADPIHAAATVIPREAVQPDYYPESYHYVVSADFADRRLFGGPMKRRVRTTALTVATLISLPALSVSALSVSARAQTPEPLTVLTLTITNGRPQPVGPGRPGTAPMAREVTLTCDPTGGTHPKAAQACADLKKVGDFAHLPTLATPRACYMIYAPVSVTATGHLGQALVQFQATYSNDCVLADQTGSVFAF
jgi:Subtilisin inhibitor-like